MGKDDEGRYILKDESCFKLSKDFLIKNKISVDKEFDGDKTYVDSHRFRPMMNSKIA